tara:strand:- start:475 stop:1650 length:1176 start_codon:yes stop_codon:yes gene_type:complete
MLIFKKTRFFSFSLIFSTIIFFVGLKFIENTTLNDKSYKSSKRASFIEAKKNNSEVVLNIFPAAWLLRDDNRGPLLTTDNRQQIGGFFPLGSAANILTIYCSEDEGFISYKTDRFGFRNANHLWENKMHDIVISGDSFAESACVKIPIQDYFDPSKKIVSVGKGANGPLTSLATITEYLESYSPKVIYHLVVRNDYSRPKNHVLDIDLEREWEDIQLQKYLKNPEFNVGYFNSLDLLPLKKFAIDYSQQLINKKNFEENILIKIIANIFSYSFMKAQAHLLINKLSVNVDSKTRLIDKHKLLKVYKAMVAKTNQKNTQIRFVIIPKKSKCTKDKAHKYITDIFKAVELNPLDLTFELCNPKFFSVVGTHFNSAGYEKLAEMITSDFKSLKK